MSSKAFTTDRMALAALEDTKNFLIKKDKFKQLIKQG